MGGQSTIIRNKERYDSYFDKTLKQSILTKVKFLVICVCSLGLLYPWALCMKYRETTHHAVVCGKRLKFIGNPKELTLHWLWWWFLSVITFGIYAIVVHIRMEQWIIANTIFEDVEIVTDTPLS